MNQNSNTEHQSRPVGQEISCVMHGVKKEFLYDNKKLESILKEALRNDKFNVLEFVQHNFTPKGYTAMSLLSESHLAVHTYPEYESLYFNMYSCRGPRDVEKTISYLTEKLKPTSIDYLKRNQVRVKK